MGECRAGCQQAHARARRTAARGAQSRRAVMILPERWLVRSGRKSLELSDRATWLLVAESALVPTWRSNLTNHR